MQTKTKPSKTRFKPSYSLSQLIFAVFQEHPDWGEEAVKEEARRLYRAILAMDRQWARSQRRFHSHVILYPDAQDFPAGSHR